MKQLKSTIKTIGHGIGVMSSLLILGAFTLIFVLISAVVELVVFCKELLIKKVVT